LFIAVKSKFTVLFCHWEVKVLVASLDKVFMEFGENFPLFFHNPFPEIILSGGPNPFIPREIFSEPVFPQKSAFLVGRM